MIKTLMHLIVKTLYLNPYSLMINYRHSLQTKSTYILKYQSFLVEFKLIIPMLLII